MRIDAFKRSLPWLMAAGRAALGPVLIAGQRSGWNGLTLAGIVVGALLSDVYDGVLARRWHCDTPAVRLFDSMADTVFYLCTAVALWIGQPGTWHRYGRLLAILLGLEALRFVFDFSKFGKPASYHSYLAKTWGLVMAIAVVASFQAGQANALIPVALGLGIMCNLEGLAMSTILPMWQNDVKHVGRAWQTRLALSGIGRQVTNSRKRRPGCFVVQAALLFLVASSKTLLCQPALAPAGWDAVERLKKGSEIVVERVLAAGEQGERVPCRVLRVGNAVLVCTPHAAKNGTRLVYAARQVDAVYQCKTHTSLNLVKAVLYAGAGWVAGGIITDDRWDYPLATMGAVGWGLVGLSSGRRELRQTLIYRRVTDEVPSQGHSGALLPATLPHPDCSATASGGLEVAR